MRVRFDWVSKIWQLQIFKHCNAGYLISSETELVHTNAVFFLVFDKFTLLFRPGLSVAVFYCHYFIPALNNLMHHQFCFIVQFILLQTHILFRVCKL